jgi:sugar phosphate isomerase/epimerase
MSKLSRREWNKLALGGLGAAALSVKGWAAARRINSRIRGVLIGVQSYTFRDRALDEAIDAMAKIGIGSCELWQGHLEPQELQRKVYQGDAQAREELRRWRLNTPLDHFKAVRRKFDRAGVDLYAYNLSFRDDFSDAEIERGFQMARALGAKAMTASSNVATARRVDPYAKRYGMRVGLHNHSNVGDPNEISTPESFQRATEATSEFIAMNLDIGHFTAANFDAVDFLRKNHSRIVTLHIKDRKHDQGPNTVWGQGDAPIVAVLDLLRRNKWPIPANIEYEYEGKDTIEEVKRCFNYCKQALTRG